MPPQNVARLLLTSKYLFSDNFRSAENSHGRWPADQHCLLLGQGPSAPIRAIPGHNPSQPATFLLRTAAAMVARAKLHLLPCSGSPSPTPSSRRLRKVSLKLLQPSSLSFLALRSQIKPLHLWASWSDTLNAAAIFCHLGEPRAPPLQLELPDPVA